MKIPSSQAVFLLLTTSLSSTGAFSPRQPYQRQTLTQRSVLQVDNEQEIELGEDNGEDLLNPRANIPRTLRINGQGIPGRKDKIQLLDTSTYESNLIKTWENDPSRQKGFDWEIEKMRRLFAGLRMREDGTWVKQSSGLNFLVSKQRIREISNSGISPTNALDAAIVMSANVLSAVGLGPALGMASVPTATIQKYEGTFFSFIKGVLGGDLQTMAGGPLFLLLNKYFLENGPIFNLAFGPKAFLVISDPVMAKHILRTASTDEYCKGMLSEILEPIMGKGLIPADPATWKVSTCLGHSFSVNYQIHSF
jgi:hypothetical protein